MGAVISSLWTAARVLWNQPILFVGIGPCSLVAVLFSFTLSQVPLVGLVVAPVAYPFVVAGVLAMADTATNGRPTVRDLLDGAKAHTIGLLLAFAAVSLVWILVGSLFAIGVLASFAYDPSTLETSMGVASVAMILVTAVLAVSVQFVDVAIVLGDLDVREGFRSAWRVIVAEPVSVLGYSVVRFVIWSVPMAIWVGIVAWYLPALIADPFRTLLVVGALVFAVGLVTIPPVWTLAYVYHVTFFRRIEERHGLLSAT